MAKVVPELSGLWQPERGQVFLGQGRRDLVADAHVFVDGLDPDLDPDTRHEMIRHAVIERLRLEITAGTPRPGESAIEIEEV